MSGNIRVTPGELRTVAGQYSTESGNVAELVSRLDNMRDHLRNIWEGASSDAFAQQYEELKPSFVQMSTLLEEVSQQLSKSADILEETDQQIASQIRG
ncbi:WXG100 family type VII secretion target [Bacillus sp. V5-8f]|uniref:WXG100 family type VII secretion target n=1 Tax=Bacillus sp. V5-8f TaxID=2053044 RepID=UPI000C78CF4F|nr:WXG100 family type VII secretion target [Bacillus sp. V5-8f]PLT31942.1 WXG100 family type VII secretion target [Bacillus sp. V5-8f]